MSRDTLKFSNDTGTPPWVTPSLTPWLSVPSLWRPHPCRFLRGCTRQLCWRITLFKDRLSLLEELESLFPGHVVLADGHATKETREAHGTEKAHAVDAYCIGCAALEGQKVFSVPETVYFIKQYRRHDRSITNFQRPRVYKLDGKRIAANRRKGTEQKEDSLEDWYNSMVQEHGKEKADALRSSLSVTKSTKRRNNTGRTMPGAVFFRDRKRHVLKGQLTGGIYYTAEDAEDVRFPEKSCKIAQKNAGLVFV